LKIRFDAAKKMGNQTEKKRGCLSPQGEWPRFPLGRPPPKEAAALQSPFFAYFLWRDKESEWSPGRPRLVTTK
jgi:hypothetical protein